MTRVSTDHRTGVTPQILRNQPGGFWLAYVHTKTAHTCARVSGTRPPAADGPESFLPWVIALIQLLRNPFKKP